jgi:hypothetical protein
MDYRSDVLQRSVAVLVLAVNLFALGACSSSTNGPMTPTVAGRNAGASPPSTYITVDDTSCTGTCANEITGINDNDDIVGNYSNCSSSSSNACNSVNWGCTSSSTKEAGCQPCPLLGGANVWHSYTSVYSNGRYSSFTNVQFPDAPNGQYMYAISDRIGSGSGIPPATIKVGCINAFAGGGSGEENGVWALLDNNELWSVHDKGGASGCDNKPDFFGTGELLGYDNTNTTVKTAVGFYTDSNKKCHFIAAEVQAGSNWQKLIFNFVTTTFSPFNVMATGITGSSTSSGSGDIVGILTTTSPTAAQEGWYLPAGGEAEPYSYTGSSATAFTGIAKIGASLDIVGWYTLPGTGTKTASTHGLLATPVGKTFTVAPINVPGASSTVVNGINAKGDICGWYTDTKGIYHGFVGLGVAALLKRHHHHLEAKHVASVSHYRYEM